MASGVTRRDVLRDLVRSGGLSVIIRACNGVLAYLMLLAIARSSSTAEYGVFAVALSIGLTIATISEFGKPQTVTRFWPQWMGQNEPRKARAVLRQSAVWVACSLAAAALLLMLAGALGKAVLMPWSFELASATALLVLAYGWGEFASAGLRSQGYVVAALAPRDILWRLGPCLFFGWAALNRMSFDAETIMLIVAGILAIIVVPQTFWLLRSATEKTSALPADDRGTVLRFSLTVWATTSLQWLIDYGGVVIVSAYLGAEAAGGYFTAVRTAYLLSFFLLSIGMIMAPQISRHYHSDRKDLVEIIVGITGLVAGTTALAGIVFFFFFGDRILSLFNPEYGAKFFTVLLIISASQFFAAVSGPVAMMLTMSGHQQVNFIVGVSVGSAGVVAQLAGGYYYGAIGVATATAAAAILTGIIKLVYVWRVLGIDPTGVSVTGMALRRFRGILRKRRESN